MIYVTVTKVVNHDNILTVSQEPGPLHVRTLHGWAIITVLVVRESVSQMQVQLRREFHRYASNQ